MQAFKAGGDGRSSEDPVSDSFQLYLLAEKFLLHAYVTTPLAVMCGCGASCLIVGFKFFVGVEGLLADMYQKLRYVQKIKFWCHDLLLLNTSFIKILGGVSWTLEGSPCYRGGSCAICTGQASHHNYIYKRRYAKNLPTELPDYGLDL